MDRDKLIDGIELAAIKARRQILGALSDFTSETGIAVTGVSFAVIECVQGAETETVGYVSCVMDMKK